MAKFDSTNDRPLESTTIIKSSAPRHGTYWAAQSTNFKVEADRGEKWCRYLESADTL